MSENENNDALAVVGQVGVVVDTGKHQEVRDKARELVQQVEETYWELSQVVYGIYQESLYLEWGYQNFKEYVESEELNFQMRKAQYLINIQDWFGKMPANIQDWIRGLGWTKAKELTGIVKAENAAEWMNKIEGKTVKEIINIVKGKDGDEGSGEGAYGEGGEGEGGEGSTTEQEKPVKMSFSLFPGQKKNVDDALAQAQTVAESDKPGNLLDLICTAYLSSSIGVDNVAEYLEKVERQIGVKLIAYNDRDETLVYGAETLDKIAPADEETQIENEG